MLISRRAGHVPVNSQFPASTSEIVGTFTYTDGKEFERKAIAIWSTLATLSRVRGFSEKEKKIPTKY